VRFKSLSQSLVLSPFSYSFYTSQVDRVLPVRCSMLQYTDNLAVYVSHVNVENAQRTVRSACNTLNEVFRNIALPISGSKSGLIFFSRNTNPSVSVTLNGRCMPVVPKFRSPGVVFDGKLL
jgi:hypothetical protein